MPGRRMGEQMCLFSVCIMNLIPDIAWSIMTDFLRECDTIHSYSTHENEIQSPKRYLGHTVCDSMLEMRIYNAQEDPTHSKASKRGFSMRAT